MRKGLYLTMFIINFTILLISILTIFMLKDYVCIRCIEIKDNVQITTSSEEINKVIYKYMSCPNCK